MNFTEACKFLKDAGVYYLATVDQEGNPRVRPFGTIELYNGRLYFQTGRVKDCSKQLEVNPYAEICAFHNGSWIRVSGKVAIDDSFEAKKNMLDAYPSLRDRYNENDGNTVVYYFVNGRITLESFTAPKTEFEF